MFQQRKEERRALGDIMEKTVTLSGWGKWTRIAQMLNETTGRSKTNAQGTPLSSLVLVVVLAQFLFLLFLLLFFFFMYISSVLLTPFSPLPSSILLPPGNSPHHTSKVSQQWNRVMVVSKAAWTDEEEANLLEEVKQQDFEKVPRSWASISEKLNGRSDTQCRYKYLAILRDRARMEPNTRRLEKKGGEKEKEETEEMEKQFEKAERWEKELVRLRKDALKTTLEKEKKVQKEKEKDKDKKKEMEKEKEKEEGKEKGKEMETEKEKEKEEKDKEEANKPQHSLHPEETFCNLQVRLSGYPKAIDKPQATIDKLVVKQQKAVRVQGTLGGVSFVNIGNLVSLLRLEAYLNGLVVNMHSIRALTFLNSEKQKGNEVAN
jgi:flagellar biosynthesis GTPase FlhF